MSTIWIILGVLSLITALIFYICCVNSGYYSRIENEAEFQRYVEEIMNGMVDNG